MGKRDSFYDPLNPTIDPAKVRPYYEDRVLVKWTPPPAEAQSDWVHAVAPSPRDKGPHYGIVVAVGPGNSGLHLKPRGREIDPHTGLPKQRFKPFMPNRIDVSAITSSTQKYESVDGKRGFINAEFMGARYHVGCTVRPGDRVYYERTPQNEFEHGGDTFTMVFEEQSILAVIE